MAVWPSQLRITRSGYSETPPRNMVRSEMDTGPAKVRRRTTSNPRMVKIMLFLNDDQLDILDEFFDETLKSGSLSFDFVNPRTGITVKARFTENPDYPQDNLHYNVSCSLEILP